MNEMSVRKTGVIVVNGHVHGTGFQGETRYPDKEKATSIEDTFVALIETVLGLISYFVKRFFQKCEYSCTLTFFP